MALPTGQMKKAKDPSEEAIIGTWRVSRESLGALRNINMNIGKLLEHQLKTAEQQKDLLDRLSRDNALKDPVGSKANNSTSTSSNEVKSDEKNGINWAVLLGGLAIGISAWADDIISALRAPAVLTDTINAIKNIFQFIGKKLRSIFTFVEGPIDFVTDIFSRVGTFFETGFGPESRLVKAFKGIRKFLAPVGEAFGSIKSLFTKIGGPLALIIKPLRALLGPVGLVIFGITDFFRGFMEGFGDGGLLGGIKGGILEAIRGLVTKPLDLIKDIVSWAAEKLGFGEFSAQLDSFSFTDMFNDFIVVLENLFEDVGKWFGTLFSDPVAAIESAAGAYLTIYKDIGTWFYNNAIKPITDWLGKQFGVDITGTIEAAAGAYLNFFKDVGTWLYNNAIKPITDWLGTLFKNPVAAIESAVGTYLNFFKDAGTWIYEKTIGPVVNWLKQTFSSDDGEGIVTKLKKRWDEGIAVLSENFKAVTNWVTSIPGKILLKAEEMWIDTMAEMKIAFLKFKTFFVSLPNKLMAIIAETIGTVDLGLGKVVLFSKEDIANYQTSAPGADNTATIAAINAAAVKAKAELTGSKLTTQGTNGSHPMGSVVQQNNKGGDNIYNGPVYNGPTHYTFKGGGTFVPAGPGINPQGGLGLI